MRERFQTPYAARVSMRKWNSEIDKYSPTKESKDWPEHKKIRLRFEKHSLRCNKCSLFALQKKQIAKFMCENGARIAAKYYNAKERWKHEDPAAFARSVVGAVLHEQAEARKRYYKEESDALERSTDSSDSLCPEREKMFPGRTDKTVSEARKEGGMF